MPYQRGSRTFRIIFDPASSPTTSLPGLEVIAKPMRFGKIYELAELDGVAGASSLTPSEEDKAVMNKGIDRLLESLVSWDMTDEDGQPVPLDRAGLDTLDIDQILELIDAWSDIIMGNLSRGKAKSSIGGQRSVEGSIPMEPLS